jgi:anaerobic magnesium-protoporphyrin IX monomethyl ester cyclase
MRVLFLEIDTERTWAVASIGPAFLAAYLRKFGHEAVGLRVPLDETPEELVEAIRRIDPGLLAVSLTTRQWQRARTIIGQVRQALPIPVVAGGLHPTFAPEEMLRHAGFDYLCLGEGEQALLELVEALEDSADVRTTIPNIWPRGGKRPPLRPPFAPTDDLPFLARDLLDEPPGLVHMATQRGCPFPCSYCAAGQYNQLYGRNSAYGRRRSHANVLAELEEISRKGSLNYIIFLDDTFTIHPVWVEEFCRVYRERFPVGFSLHARPDTVDPTMLRHLADAGCRHIVFGVESGSPRLRQQVMQRPISNERMIDAFRWTRDAGILATANYMLGLPGETRDDLEETLALHDRLAPVDFGYSVFYPYPGTHLFHVCRDRGYLPENYLDLPANHRESILRLPELTTADISEYYDRFTALRERDQLARLGGVPAPESIDLIRESVRQCAAVG